MKIELILIIKEEREKENEVDFGFSYPPDGRRIFNTNIFIGVRRQNRGYLLSLEDKINILNPKQLLYFKYYLIDLF